MLKIREEILFSSSNAIYRIDFNPDSKEFSIGQSFSQVYFRQAFEIDSYHNLLVQDQAIVVYDLSTHKVINSFPKPDGFLNIFKTKKENEYCLVLESGVFFVNIFPKQGGGFDY